MVILCFTFWLCFVIIRYLTVKPLNCCILILSELSSKGQPINAHSNELSEKMARQSLALMFEPASVVTRDKHVNIKCGEDNFSESMHYLVHMRVM